MSTGHGADGYHAQNPSAVLTAVGFGNWPRQFFRASDLTEKRHQAPKQENACAEMDVGRGLAAWRAVR